MRTDDQLSALKVFDNRAASFASEQAQEDGVPLIVLFVISPQDYKAHDRGSRRIDFMLRNLKVVKVSSLYRCSDSFSVFQLHEIRTSWTSSISLFMLQR